jgi:hypothetical protein
VLVVALGLALASCGGGEAKERATTAPAERQVLSADDALELLAPRRAEGNTRPSPATVVGPPAPPPGASVVFAARLIDEHFRPVPTGSLSLLRAGPAGPEEVVRAPCDGNGSVWLGAATDALPAGACVLVARAPGFARTEVRAEAPRGGTGGIVGLGEVLLAPGGDVRGRVVDASGQPVARARVWLGRVGSSQVEGEELARLHPPFEPALSASFAEADERGEYVLESAPVGLWAVQASPHPAEDVLVPVVHEEVRVVARETAELPALVLATPRPDEVLSGRVRGPDGEPVAGARLALLDDATGADTGVAAWSRADGSFRLLVPAGRGWRLAAHEDAARFAPVRSAVVVGGAEVELEFESVASER